MYVCWVQLVKFFTVREELRTPLPLEPPHTEPRCLALLSLFLRLLGVSRAEFSSELPLNHLPSAAVVTGMVLMLSSWFQA